METLTTEQIALINAPVAITVEAAPVAASVPKQKGSRLRPAVQNRRASVTHLVLTALSDGNPRGVTEVTRDVEKLGGTGFNLWGDVYNALKTDSRFASRFVSDAKRPKFYLIDAADGVVEAPASVPAPVTVNLPDDGGFSNIVDDPDLAELMAA